MSTTISHPSGSSRTIAAWIPSAVVEEARSSLDSIGIARRKHYQLAVAVAIITVLYILGFLLEHTSTRSTDFAGWLGRTFTTIAVGATLLVVVGCKLNEFNASNNSNARAL